MNNYTSAPMDQIIDQLHSEWSMMDKTAKLLWLKQKQNELYTLANQKFISIRLKGGRMTNMEKAEAQKLFEMIDAVNAEGMKTTNELKGDILKELMKGIIE